MKKVILILIILSLLTQGQSFALRPRLRFNEPEILNSNKEINPEDYATGEEISITSGQVIPMPDTDGIYVVDYLLERYVDSDEAKTRLFAIVEKEGKDIIAKIISKEDNGTIKLWEKHKFIKGKFKSKYGKYVSGKWKLVFVNMEAYITAEEMPLVNRFPTFIPRTNQVHLPDYLMRLYPNIKRMIVKEKGNIITKIFSREDGKVIVWERYRFIPCGIITRGGAYFIGKWKRIFYLENYTVSREMPIAVVSPRLIPEGENRLYIPRYLMETYVNPNKAKTRLFAMLKKEEGYINCKIISRESDGIVKYWGNHKFILAKIKKQGVEFAGKWKFEWSKSFVAKKPKREVGKKEVSRENSSKKISFYRELKRQLKMGNKIKDYYKRLGLGIYATTDEIKRAYRMLVMQFHPDQGKDSDAKVFKLIKEAYEVLKDPKKRQSYDRFMRNSFKPTELKKINSYLERPENIGVIFHFDKRTGKRVFLIPRKVVAKAVKIDVDLIDWAIEKHNYQQHRKTGGYFTPFSFPPEKMLNSILETADAARTDN
ncbi:MAG: DnaJ domain-containing protein [Candidatus Gorgyraea atricola]|nr:DnaJ domain-containing protein [Candidatus Gorgyraea atricola]